MMDFRSSYLKVEVCLCEILVQCRGQVLDCSDYNTAVREQGVGRVKRLTMASYSLASTVYGPCANFLSTTSSRVRCDFKGEREMAQTPQKTHLGEMPHQLVLDLALPLPGLGTTSLWAPVSLPIKGGE